MKKVISLITVFLACIVAACAMCLAGCSKSEDAEILFLEDCVIGTEIPVYPSCEFDYEVSEDFVVHVSGFRAILTEKNYIQDNDKLSGYYYTPYTITISCTGQTTLEMEGTKLSMHVFVQPGAFSVTGDAYVDSDGLIEWNFDCVNIDTVTTIYLNSIAITR